MLKALSDITFGSKSEELEPLGTFLGSVGDNYRIRFLDDHIMIPWWTNIRLSTFNRFLAARVGEASSPGPAPRKTCQQLTVAICNPTAILTKKNELLNLNSSVILLSETSATQAVQGEFSHSLRDSQCRIFYGPPVVAKRTLIDGRGSFRGEAIGTAIMTKLPSRKTFCDIPDDLKNSCRVNTAIIRINQIEVLMVACYGFPSNGPETKRQNDILLAHL